MKTRAGLALGTAALVQGCFLAGDQCTTLILEYEGTAEGTVVIREVSADGSFRFGHSIGSVEQALQQYGDPGPFAHRGSCVSPGEVREDHVEAWIDLDGDDAATCGGDDITSPDCGPDPGEPYGELTQTIELGQNTVRLRIEDRL